MCSAARFLLFFTILMSPPFLGKDVVILKEGERICGTGAALGTLPIAQNKAYFQVNVQQSGKCSCSR